jgi:hypothetical protein
MNAPTTFIQSRIESMRSIQVPQDLSKRAHLWKMAKACEIAEHSVVLRAIAVYDILESPYIIPDLYKLHGHIVSGPDGDEKVTHIIALLCLNQIAEFFGY